MTSQSLPFQAEVSRLLDIVAHALYAEKEVFLRELISNASDACDKLRYLAITEPHLAPAGLAISVSADAKAGTLTVTDTGIGMDRAEMIANLGTIAKSGTADFLAAAKAAGQGSGLIGQFGVGFYAAFMVADQVVVRSRRAGSDEGHEWRSDGKSGFEIAPCDTPTGTSVTLHLKKDAAEYLDEKRLRAVIAKYSDHIAFPIRLGAADSAVNQEGALWMRPKSDITEDQYREFYHHSAHAFDTPLSTLHWKAEGKIEYTALLYIPSLRPGDLYEPERQNRLKLYVRRVFITDRCEGLVPSWLRFLRGVVDSEDLPLNISRETLQQSPLLAKIRQGITKKLLAEMERMARDSDAWAKFWTPFGAVVKEGLYEAPEHRDQLLALCRFRSTHGPEPVSLADYVSRMKPGQDAIFTLSGGEAEKLAHSPQLEGFRAAGVEVLLLSDPIDEFWIPMVNEFQGHPFRSVTRAGEDLKKIRAGAGDKAAPAGADAATTALMDHIRKVLGDAVKDVRASDRLTDSAVCLTAAEGDVDLALERILRANPNFDLNYARVLEINPGHALIRRLAALARDGGDAAALDDAIWLLLDQARILEGDPVTDPAAFARRLSSLVEKGLAA